MSKRYSVKWRRPYRKQSLRRLNTEALNNRTERRAAKLIRRALNGDIDALVTILKATGELPKDYELSDE
jgi:hypothetical protein